MVETHCVILNVLNILFGPLETCLMWIWSHEIFPKERLSYYIYCYLLYMFIIYPNETVVMVVNLEILL